MPRIETVTTTVYQFNELSDDAKQRAREWYLQDFDQSFHDFHVETCLDTINEIALMLGIEITTRNVPLMNGTTRKQPAIWYSLDYSHYPGVGFDATCTYRKGCLAALRKEFPNTCKEWRDLHSFAEAYVEFQRGHGFKATVDVRTVGRSDTEIEATVSNDYGELYRSENEATELMRDFTSWALSYIEAEYRFQSSDEQVDDNITANEYEFTEDGNIA